MQSLLTDTITLCIMCVLPFTQSSEFIYQVYPPPPRLGHANCINLNHCFETPDLIKCLSEDVGGLTLACILTPNCTFSQNVYNLDEILPPELKTSKKLTITVFIQDIKIISKLPRFLIIQVLVNQPGHFINKNLNSLIISRHSDTV